MAINDRADLGAALLIERLVREAYSERGPGSITPLQWAILRALGRSGDFSATQGWITRFVNVTAAPVSRSIRALERHGAVITQRDPEDGRQVIVTLTTSGHELLAKDPILTISRRISDLEGNQKVALRHALQHLFLAQVATD